MNKKTKCLGDVLKDFLPILEKQLEVADVYPVRIGDKYGLVEGGELSDEDEAKAKQEWKDIYSRIIFLIKEMDEKTCTSPFAKKVNDALVDKIAIRYTLDSIEDTNSDEYKNLMEEYNKVDEIYDQTRVVLQRYQNVCKDELFDLLKTWWWDLLFY